MSVTAAEGGARVAAGQVAADADLILNAHGHRDHARGNATLQSASSEETSLHAGDIDLPRESETHLAWWADPSYVMRALGWAELLAERSPLINGKTDGPFEVSMPAKEGDLVPVHHSGPLRVVHTHTPDGWVV